MEYADEKTNLLTLEKYVSKGNGAFLLEDAVSVTGLPVIETEFALKQMMGRYDCKLKVTDQGDLIYDFGTQLNRRSSKTFKEKLDVFLSRLWQLFTIAYKVITSLFLIVYFVVFLLLLIGLIFGSNSKDNKGGGHLIASFFRIFISIFEWHTILSPHDRYYKKDRYGYSYQHFREKPGVLQFQKAPKNEKKKGFVASIFDFIFGPPRVKIDPLANNQEVATFLKEQKGLITTSEIQALAGWTRAEAENFMTECLGMFDGEGQVSDQGALYGEFDQLIRSKDRTGAEPVIWFWDEYEPEVELTGNSKDRNMLIAGMNIFNLFMSYMIISSAGMQTSFDLGSDAAILLGWIPLIYSTLFFLIPLIRYFINLPKQKAQHKLNIRKRLMKVVFQTYDMGSNHIHEIPLKQLEKEVNKQGDIEEVLDKVTIEKVMRSTLSDLGGEAYLNDKNEIVYSFELISRELNEIDRIRAAKKEDGGIGDVVFES